MDTVQKQKLLKELRFQTSRSSGKGGQNVNKTETRVELIFSVADSNALSDEEKSIVMRKLKNRITDEGLLKICSSQHRSQGMNKQHTIDKFFDRLNAAVQPEKKRIATKIPKSVKAVIKKAKKINSEKKASRKMRTRDYLN